MNNNQCVGESSTICLCKVSPMGIIVLKCLSESDIVEDGIEEAQVISIETETE